MEHASTHRDAVEGQPTAPSGVRLLVIDDDPHVCRSIANAMSRIGFHVFAAEDGAPALELTTQTPPDLAIVDYHMPTPGPDVVRQLKAAHGPAIFITVLSGRDDEETRAACFEAGADDVLSKPVNMDELRRRMVAAARTQQAHVEARLAQERAERRRAYDAEAAAMLAHDLKHGLAVALSSILSIHGAVELGDDEERALAAAATELRRMSGLVANFVEIAHFEDAARKPRTSTNNVRALLLEVLEVHASTAARSVGVEVECDPALAGKFDLALLERVLHCLVGSAIRHCEPGGVVRLAARRADPLLPASLELVVWNSGPPVPDAVRDRLFASSEKSSNGKRGFGLYFCRLACEAHGGTISYRPIDGGAEFCLRLPGRS